MEPLRLSVRALKKSYPGVKALDGVTLDVREGEVHALLGENGAGKSTLLKILSGAIKADEGVITFDGLDLPSAISPMARQELGIVTIYQEFNLVPEMTVAENLFLGREPVRLGIVDRGRMHAETNAILDRLGVNFTATTLVATLTIAAQQMVEIARALTFDAKLIIMDEPTAALSDKEVQSLHRTVKELKADGVSIIYVTHRLGEVHEICDAYTVLRDGRFVTTGRVADATVQTFVSAMVGREIVPLVRTPNTSGEVVLKIENVCRQLPGSPKLEKVSLSVRAGEILGLAGLVGSGRTELVRQIFGADNAAGAVLWLSGDKSSIFRSPGEAMMRGLAMVTEDRKNEGCFLQHSIRWNLSLPSLTSISRFGFINERAERDLVADFIARLNIRTPNDSVAIGSLSGGNQQKVLLARCMALKPKVLIVDEPTRGIDIGAKGEVHQILFDLADEGVAVIVISSDMPELLDLADRTVVLCEGHKVGELGRADTNETVLMKMMTGNVASPVESMGVH